MAAMPMPGIVTLFMIAMRTSTAEAITERPRSAVGIAGSVAMAGNLEEGIPEAAISEADMRILRADTLEALELLTVEAMRGAFLLAEGQASVVEDSTAAGSAAAVMEAVVAGRG
jgi:hypothetical protein